MKIKELKSQVNTYKNQEFDIPDVSSFVKTKLSNENLEVVTSIKPRRSFFYRARFALSFGAVALVAICVLIPVAFGRGFAKSYAPNEHDAEPHAPAPSVVEPENDAYGNKQETPEPSFESDEIVYDSALSVNSVSGYNIISSSLEVTDEEYSYDASNTLASYTFVYNYSNYYLLAVATKNIEKYNIKDTDPLFDTTYSNDSVLSIDSEYYIKWVDKNVTYVFSSDTNSQDEFIEVYNSIK